MGLLPETVRIKIQSVQKLKIHDSVFYDIVYKQESTDSVESTRINEEAFYANPSPGDEVEVNLVLGNIMGAKKLS